MAQLTLFLGGVRSGKSRWAEDLAARHPPVVYLATAQPLHAAPGEPPDAEMAVRVAEHRRRRAARHPDWRTAEEPWDVPAAVLAHAGAGCVLVECLTLWLTNLLLGAEGRAGLTDAEVAARVADLTGLAGRVPARVVVVSNEVGCGVIPANPLARRFGDRLGEANQRLAAEAAEVYACVAGLPLRLKPTLSVGGPEGRNDGCGSGPS